MDKKYVKKVCLNVLKAVIIFILFIILNILYKNISTENFDLTIKILTMVFLFISIFIIEISYKKDDFKLTLEGIETLVLSTYILTIKHITNRFEINFKEYLIISAIIFIIYFILKSILIYTKGNKEVVNSLSDVKDIVKKEKPIKKEATKKSH